MRRRASSVSRLIGDGFIGDEIRASYRAAGILPLHLHVGTGSWWMLIGADVRRRKGRIVWGDFGGKRELSDCDRAEVTAMRELREEMMGVVHVIAGTPCAWNSAGQYVLYFVALPEAMDAHRMPASDAKSAFSWVPLLDSVIAVKERHHAATVPVLVHGQSTPYSQQSGSRELELSPFFAMTLGILPSSQGELRAFLRKS